jgi:hypothetical protein
LVFRRYFHFIPVIMVLYTYKYWFKMLNPAYYGRSRLEFKFQASLFSHHTEYWSKAVIFVIISIFFHDKLYFIYRIHNLYTLVCRFHVNKEVYWFLNRPPPFPPRTPPFWLFTNTWWSFSLTSQNRKILWHHSSQWWNPPIPC